MKVPASLGFRSVSSNKLGCLHTKCLKVDNNSD